jgi:hypothetical protein
MFTGPWDVFFTCVWALLLFGVILGSTVFWMWMIIHCATQGPSRGIRRVIWIAAMVLTGVIGAAVYYFIARPKPKAKMLAVAVLADCLFFFMVFTALWYFTPPKNQVSEHARTEWSQAFRQVGLAAVPRNAKYLTGPHTDGRYHYWNFRADAATIQRWLSDSESIHTARVRAYPGTKKYLMTVSSANKECLLVVVERGEECWVMVHTVDLTIAKRGNDSQRRNHNTVRQDLQERFEMNEAWPPRYR